MQLQITLSKKEKRYYFIYLLGMLLLAVIFLGILFLNKFRSPFSNNDTMAVKTLLDKAKFEKRQLEIQPKVDSTFIKLKKISSDNKQPVEEGSLESDINTISDAFSSGFDDDKFVDSRKNSYPQIAKFYKMYKEDKEIIITENQNVDNLNKLYIDCTGDMKDKQREISSIRSTRIQNRK